MRPVAEQLHPPEAWTPRINAQRGYSSSDSNSDSDSSGPELLYPSSAKLLDQIEEALFVLRQDAHRETLRCPGFSDLIMKLWNLHANAASADPCDIWRQLEENCQLCQEFKQEHFSKVAGPCIINLLEVACSFSSVRWIARHTVQMLTIFDMLADVLYNIRDISFTRIEFTDNKIADIFCGMVNTVKVLLEVTERDIQRSKAQAIHPATKFLIQALKFFYQYRDMVRPILTPEDCTVLLSWISKLEKDAERMYQDEKYRQYVFILNNTWFVWQKRDYPRGFLSNEQVESLNSVIQRYIKSYLGYWAPLLTYLKGDSLRSQSSLHKFRYDFDHKLHCQMNWKVRSELKYILRQEITNLIIQRYEQFLVAQEVTQSSTFFAIERRILDLLCFGKKRGDIYTVEHLESTLVVLFER